MSLPFGHKIIIIIFNLQMECSYDIMGIFPNNQWPEQPFRVHYWFLLVWIDLLTTFFCWTIYFLLFNKF